MIVYAFILRNNCSIKANNGSEHKPVGNRVNTNKTLRIPVNAASEILPFATNIPDSGYTLC